MPKAKSIVVRKPKAAADSMNDWDGAWIIVILAFSAQIDLALGFGALTVYHNELLLALVAGVVALRAHWRGSLSRDLWWALPLFFWLALHGLWPGPMAEGVKAPLRAAQLFLGFFLPAALLKDEEAWRRTAWAALAALAISALWGMAQSLAGPGHALNAGRQVELIGSFQAAAAGMGHHNQFGAALVPGLGLAAMLAIFGRPGERLIARALVATLLAALLCSFSRGAWLAGLLLAMGLLPSLDRRWRRTLLSVGLVGLLLMLFGPWESVRDRAAGVFQDSDRLRFWANALPYLRDHWLWGWGWPKVTEISRLAAEAMGRDRWATQAFSSHPHSFYLQQGLAFGLPVLGLWVLAGKSLVSAVLETGKEPRRRSMRLVLAACLAGLLFQSATDILTLHARGFLPALFCGLILAGLRLPHTKE